MRLIRRPHHRAQRRINGALCTPLHTWRRGDQEIRLTGMIHVADQGFYAHVQRLAEYAEDHDGAQVHYERLHKEGPNAVLTDEEATLLTNRPHVYRALAEASGLVAQSDALNLRTSWHNHDLDRLTAVRGMGMRAARFLYEHVGKAVPDLSGLDMVQRERVRIRTRRMLSRGTVPGGDLVLRLVLGAGAMNTVEHWRNLHAVTRALSVVHLGPVVMLWGAGHLAGMGDILADNGFRLDDPVLWVEAIQ